jgi:hypothetical protein
MITSRGVRIAVRGERREHRERLNAIPDVRDRANLMVHLYPGGSAHWRPSSPSVIE